MITSNGLTVKIACHTWNRKQVCCYVFACTCIKAVPGTYVRSNGNPMQNSNIWEIFYRQTLLLFYSSVLLLDKNPDPTSSSGLGFSCVFVFNFIDICHPVHNSAVKSLTRVKCVCVLLRYPVRAVHLTPRSSLASYLNKCWFWRPWGRLLCPW